MEDTLIEVFNYFEIDFLNNTECSIVVTVLGCSYIEQYNLCMSAVMKIIMVHIL